MKPFNSLSAYCQLLDAQASVVESTDNTFAKAGLIGVFSLTTLLTAPVALLAMTVEAAVCIPFNLIGSLYYGAESVLDALYSLGLSVVYGVGLALSPIAAVVYTAWQAVNFSELQGKFDFGPWLNSL